MAKTTDIIVPSLGESVNEATVSAWLKKEGDVVNVDEPILELETDKVTLEVNAPVAGVLLKIEEPEGAVVEMGALLGLIEGAALATSTAAVSAQKEEILPQQIEEEESHKLSPAVRKLVDDHNIDADRVKGTGKDGRLLKSDVEAFIEQREKQAVVPSMDVLGTHPVQEKTVKRVLAEREERVPMTRLRQSIAKRLKEAQDTAAMLTTFNEIDMKAVMDLRHSYKDVFEKKHGVKLGFMSFFVRAVVNALKDFPAVNAEINGTDIVYKNYYDIGVAVSTPQGLVVPVVRDCEGKSMANIEAEIMDLGVRAREGKLAMEEMMGGTFTITNGGVFGSLMSTPILNPPQSAILGMHKIQQRAMVMPDGSIEARPMMYLALSYDHRIIDGREAVSFLVRVKEGIEDPQRLVLDI